MTKDNRAHFNGELMREILKCLARGPDRNFSHGLIYGMGHMYMIKGGDYAGVCELIARHLPKKYNSELLHPAFCDGVLSAICRIKIKTDCRRGQEKKQTKPKDSINDSL